jgi:hypothetical protein
LLVATCERGSGTVSAFELQLIVCQRNAKPDVTVSSVELLKTWNLNGSVFPAFTLFSVGGLETGDMKPTNRYATLYVTDLDDAFPALSVAFTVKVNVPYEEVAILAPFATVPLHVATPEESEHE